jgi:membrane protein
MKAYIQKVIHFFTEGIWRISKDDIRKHHFFFIQVVRIFILAVRSFLSQNCIAKASGLTYYTLISIVPIVAMAFGIAKGFGFDTVLESELHNQLAGHQEVVEQIMGVVRNYLDNAKGGMIAGVGLAVLIWSLMKVLGSIEAAFNEIWEINRPRTVIRKFSDYLSLMMVALLFVASSSSMIVFVRQEFGMTRLGTYMDALFGFVIPYLLIWLVFTVLLQIMPNTKVKFKSALIGGVLSGTMFQILQYYYIHFQVSMSSYNAIYGSFAAIPLFLIWLNTSWMIVLLGAELAYAAQNVKNYEYEHDSNSISFFYRKQITVYITRYIVKAYEREATAPTIEEIAFDLKLPIRLVKETLQRLIDSGVVAEVIVPKSTEVGYHPNIDIHKLSLGMLLKKVETHGTNDFLTERNADLNSIKEKLVAISYSHKVHELDHLVKDL